MSSEKKKLLFHIILSQIPMFLIIMIMQVSDSFCTELFGKLQSLYLTEFLIDGMGLDPDAAAAKLSFLSIPFLLISATTPLARSLADYFGKKLVFIANILILIAGCILCGISKNIGTFIIGSGLIAFGYSMDLQYVFIVDYFPEHIRATIRGIAGGISAGAAMLIPVFRFILVDYYQLNWRSVYFAAIAFCVVILILSIIMIKDKPSETPSSNDTASSSTTTSLNDTLSNETSSAKRTLASIWKSCFKAIKAKSELKSVLLLLFILGIATAGISYYNEPLITFAYQSEAITNIALLWEPILIILATVISGFVADRIGRMPVITINIILTVLSLLGYAYCIHFETLGILTGIFWGSMVGCYFCAIDTFQLVILELTPSHQLGTMSSIASLTYGLGDAIGIAFVTLTTSILHMLPVKLVVAIPFSIITIIGTLIYMKKNKKPC